MKDWIDNNLIHGNMENDGIETFIPRDGLYSYEKNLGKYKSLKEIKKQLKVVLPKLIKLQANIYTIAELIDCDGITIIAENIYQDISDKKVLSSTCLSINNMLSDNRADSSIHWVIVLPNCKSWLLIIKLTQLSTHVFLYNNKNMGKV